MELGPKSHAMHGFGAQFHSGTLIGPSGKEGLDSASRTSVLRLSHKLRACASSGSSGSNERRCVEDHIGEAVFHNSYLWP